VNAHRYTGMIAWGRIIMGRSQTIDEQAIINEQGIE